MARLQIERQEKYASYRANGYTQMAAYKAAGYTCKNSTAAANASKLDSDPDVRARIEELSAKALEKANSLAAPPLPQKKLAGDGQEVDLDFINREYLAFLTIAKEEKDLKNAAVLLKDLAEINKVRPEKSEGNNNDNKLPHLGPQVAISFVNQESSASGRASDGFYAIELPNPEPVFANNSSTDEDG